jgi:hypothetical protein
MSTPKGSPQIPLAKAPLAKVPLAKAGRANSRRHHSLAKAPPPKSIFRTPNKARTKGEYRIPADLPPFRQADAIDVSRSRHTQRSRCEKRRIGPRKLKCGPRGRRHPGARRQREIYFANGFIFRLI